MTHLNTIEINKAISIQKLGKGKNEEGRKREKRGDKSMTHAVKFFLVEEKVLHELFYLSRGDEDPSLPLVYTCIETNLS